MSETNLTTSGKTRLMIDVHTPPDTDVKFPEISKLIHSFSIADHYSEPLQTLPNSKHLHRQVWTLVPNHSGSAVFEPFLIQVGETRITTDSIHLHISSLLPPDLVELRIKDIVTPIIILPEQQKKRFWTIWAVILIAVILFTRLIYKHHETNSEVGEPTSYEIALEALQQLPDAQPDRIHALTEILIRFIGNRFDINATTQTLSEITAMLPSELSSGQKMELSQRLKEAEQIRFSNKIPNGFPREWEMFVRTWMEDMKEGSCD